VTTHHKDPPVPEDGMCAVCGEPRPEPLVKARRALHEMDPFCSTTCCRIWYGLALQTPSGSGTRPPS
jgi:hypothetical protein